MAVEPPQLRESPSGVPVEASAASLVMVDVQGIAWSESIPGNSYVVKDLGVMVPAAEPNSPAVASFSGSDVNVGLVINTAEIDGAGHLIIQILNTIPAAVSPPLDPEGDVTAVYTPA